MWSTAIRRRSSRCAWRRSSGRPASASAAGPASSRRARSETCRARRGPSGRTKCVSSRPSCRARRFIERHRTGSRCRAHVIGERPGGVVRALDQQRLDEVAHARFARSARRSMLDSPTRRRIGRDRDHVAEPRTLERDQHGHHLRQARDRDALARIVREQHLSGASVLDEVGARVDARSGRRGRAERGASAAARDEQAQLHGREG